MVRNSENAIGHISQAGPKKVFFCVCVCFCLFVFLWKNTPILIQEHIACNVYT